MADQIIIGADIDPALFNKKLEEMIKGLDTADKKVGQLEQSLKKAEKAVEEQAKDISKLNEQLTLYSKKITDLESKHNSASEAINKFNNRTGTSASTIGKLEHAVNSVNNKLGVFLQATIGGLAVTALTALAKKIFEVNVQLTEMEKREKVVSEITNKAASAISQSFAKLELFRQKLNDTNISQKERIKLAETYNKIADKANQIDIKQIDNIGQVNNVIASQIALLKERAIARAAESIIADRAEKLLLAQEKARVKQGQILELDIKAGRVVFPDGVTMKMPNGEIVFIPNSDYVKQLNKQQLLTERISTDPGIKAAKEELDRALSVAGGLVNIESLFGEEKTRRTKIKKEVQKVLKDTAAAMKEAKDTIFKELEEISLQRQSLEILNIRDDFSRQEAEINLQYDKQRDFIIKKRTELKKQISQLVITGVIDKKEGQKRRNLVESLFDQFTEDVELRRTNQLIDLEFKKFLSKVANLQAIAEESEVKLAEDTAKLIQAQQARYSFGQISYKKFQENITQILKEAADKRNQIRLKELRLELTEINKQVGVTTDPEQKKTLEDKQRSIRKQIADIESEVDKFDDNTPNRKEKLKLIADYSTAIGQLTENIISFWQKTNEAEQKALERSITLQESRVEAARRIAERGNAEYLQLEEERLRELQLKRENAARRELAINAVLQTSQALVAFTTALAQGVATGGPLGGIAIAAAVIGLLASGYAIVSSLQAEQPRLFKGTKYLDRGNNPKGRDTVPALLNEGEAVIPTDTNRDYKQAVDAIYDRTVPAHEMNRFVNMYKRNGVPRVDYDRLESANNFFIGQDGRLYGVIADQNKKIEETNRWMKTMTTMMKKMGVNVTLDRNGFALSMIQASRQITIDKKS